jgi:hypothetical protein
MAVGRIIGRPAALIPPNQLSPPSVKRGLSQTAAPAKRPNRLTSASLLDHGFPPEGFLRWVVSRLRLPSRCVLVHRMAPEVA